MIICVAGLPGSGKSEASKAFAARGYKPYELGSIVWELMRKARVERNSDNTKRFITTLREKYGREVMARFLLKKIRLTSDSKIAIIGVRSMAELNYIRKRSKTVTIAIVAPPRLRFTRISRRMRPDDPKSLAQFIRNRDRKEIAFGANDVIAHADYIIANTGSKADLERNVEHVLSLIR
jgi:dephospho-CoA kinase